MKKFLSACLAVLLLVSLCISVNAAANSKLLHAYYSFDDSTLVALGAPLPDGGTAAVTLASQEDLTVELSTVADASLGTTFYCVVDTSSAMSKQAKDYEVAILTKLCDSLGKEDSMVIVTVGDTITESKLLTTPEARKDAISGIVFDSNYTDLYQAVNDGLDHLLTKTDYSFNRCMVVLSDGSDDGRTSVTESAVLQKIEDSTIPVFGVGLLQEYPSDYSRTLTNTLERMAKSSVGGCYFETSQQGSSTTEIAVGTWAAMQNTSVFRLNLAGLNRAKLSDTLLLTVRYDTEDAVYEDSISILTSDLPAGMGIKPGTPAATTAVEQETEPEKSFPTMLVVGVCIAAAAVIAAIIVIVVKKRSAKKKSEPEWNGAPNSAMPVEQMGSVTTPISAEVPEVEEAIPEQALYSAIPTEPSGPSLHLKLTAIGHMDQSFAFALPKDQPKTVGRDDRSDIVLRINGETDPKMSGRHCTLQWDGSRLFVSDNRSTNGTFVNGGQVIPGSVQQLENGCVLRIGSREYRINIES